MFSGSVRSVVLKSRAAFFFVLASLSGVAAAQDVPKVISPLRVEPDVNGVNVVSGKITISPPSISVPAAPRLKFDGSGNAAPYVFGETRGGTVGGAFTITSNKYSVHTGQDQSESFSCIEYSECRSVSGQGGTFEPLANVYTEPGSGAVYTMDLLQSTSSTSTLQTSMYYASKVAYPDGEVISYTYNTVQQIVGGQVRTYYRPTAISTNLGYTISITYQSATFGTLGWSTPQQATLYATAAPAVPLARLTYSGSTITDLAGRIYQCTGCTFSMGEDVDTAVGTATLPGEATATLQVSRHPTIPVVTSVVKDGITWTYTYTNLRANGYASSYLYDNLTVSGPDSYNIVYTMGISGQRNIITSVKDSLNRTTSIANDGFFRPTTITQPEGNSVVIAYDSIYGNITSKTTKAKPGSGLADLVETANFNTVSCTGVACYRPTWVRDPMGRQTDFLYNTAGQITEQTDPADASGVRRKTYNTYESVLVGAGALSRKKVVRVCGTGAACGTSSEIRTEYDYWQNTFLPSVERRIDAARGITLTTTYSYDAAGRILSVDGPLAGTSDATYFRYDAVGRKTWEIGPLMGNSLRTAKRFTYRDSDDKVVATEIGSVTDPASTTLSVLEREDLSYDARRNLARSAKSGGGVTYTVNDRSYTNRNFLDCSTVRMNISVFGSLPASACTASTTGTDGPDRITKNSYDAAGQLLKVTEAFGTVDQADEVTNTYSLNGKLATVTDAGNNRTTYEYDGFDRLLKTRYPVPTLGALVSSTTDYEQLGYDPSGNVTSRRLRDGQMIYFTFDSLNRMTFKDVPNAVYYDNDITYTYDLVGRPTFINNGQSRTVGYVYDALGRKITENGPFGAISMEYDAGGRMTKLTHVDGFFVNYDYDAAGNVTAIRENGATAGVGVLAAYSYDGLGKRTFITRGNGTVTNYAYDPVSRLIGLRHDVVGTSNDVTFGQAAGFGTPITYNPASQITSYSRDNDSYRWNGHYNVDRTYGVNGLNQLTTAGATPLGYDGRGNLTNSGAYTYGYTSENRLTSRNADTLAIYDSAGRLTSFYGPGTIVTDLEYVETQLIAERQQGGAYPVLRRYVFGPGEDEPIVWYEGAGTSDRRWLHANEQGSVVGWSDTNGNMVGKNAYDEYGIPASANTGRFQYTGQTWISELGMYYYKARFYSPTLGRFMQTDPTGYDDGPNWYDYVGGDPVNRSDPSGLCGVRGSHGGCIVKSADMPSERLAARRLADRLTALDKKINALGDKTNIPVIANGKIVSNITGAQLKSIWNRQTWTISNEGTDLGDAYGETNVRGNTQMEKGKSTLSPSIMRDYQKFSGDRQGINTLIGHELGHMFKDAQNYKPGIRNLYEGRAHSFGSAIMRSINEPFDCSSAQGCR